MIFFFQQFTLELCMIHLTRCNFSFELHSQLLRNEPNKEMKKSLSFTGCYFIFLSALHLLFFLRFLLYIFLLSFLSPFPYLLLLLSFFLSPFLLPSFSFLLLLFFYFPFLMRLCVFFPPWFLYIHFSSGFFPGEN